MVLDFTEKGGLLDTSNQEESSGGQNVTLFEDLNKDPLNSAGILSSTINHPDTSGTFFNIFDGDVSSGWVHGDNSTNEATSTIVIDLNRTIKTSVTGIYYFIKVSSGGSDNTSFKIEYSLDNSTYTTWFDIDYTGFGTNSFEKFLFNKSFRYLKLTIFTDTTAAIEGQVDIRLLKISR